MHFDLKSANVLLGRDWTAKIADVGLAKILKDGWLVNTARGLEPPRLPLPVLQVLYVLCPCLVLLQPKSCTCDDCHLHRYIPF